MCQMNMLDFVDKARKLITITDEEYTMDSPFLPGGVMKTARMEYFGGLKEVELFETHPYETLNQMEANDLLDEGIKLGIMAGIQYAFNTWEIKKFKGK